MIAKYNTWYKCQQGQMPENFENVIDPKNRFESKYVVLCFDDVPHKFIETDYRRKNQELRWGWRNAHNYRGCAAWMIPEPYKE